MSNHSDVNLSINEILLDPINPRHDPLQPQIELIKAMIDDQEDKLVKLAQDIIEFGLNPADLTTVIPHHNEKDKYTVVEGNRRITVLKLLNSPSLCHIESIRKRFVLLSQTYLKNPIKLIKCVLYSDRKEADHWINLKHTGENLGVGTVGWNATNKERFKAQSQNIKESLALQLINFMVNNLNLDETSAKKIRNMPISTVERLIGDPDVRKFLGLDINDGDLISRLNVEAASTVFYDFFAPIATGEKKVNVVYYKDDRKKYMEDFGSGPINTPDNISSKKWALNSPPKPAAAKPNIPLPPVKPRSKPLSINRKYLIPSSCGIKITVSRINDIYYELKTNLIVDDVPNACAVLLRLLLELSIDNYNKVNSVGFSITEDLNKKMVKVADFMEKSRVLTNKELKTTRLAACKPHALFSTNTLNAYVHDPLIKPNSKDLKNTWDEMELFVRNLWQ